MFSMHACPGSSGEGTTVCEAVMCTGPQRHIVEGLAMMAHAKLKSMSANYSARCKCYPSSAPKHALYGCDSKHQRPSQAPAGQGRPIVRAPPQELPISRATNQNIITFFCQANIAEQHRCSLFECLEMVCSPVSNMWANFWCCSVRMSGHQGYFCSTRRHVGHAQD